MRSELERHPNTILLRLWAAPAAVSAGGGQPQVHAQDLMDIDLRSLRAKALYEEDVSMTERKSHKNADVEALYKNFLGEPNGHLSHELLHTHYHSREIYPDGLLEK